MSTVKVLLIHNILWSHYKAAVFSSLYDICQRNGKNFLVIQIAETEGSRKSMDRIDVSLHRYSYRLLFKEKFEAIGKLRRSIVLCREIISQRPDIVVLPGYYDISFWFALLTVKILGVPAILTFDSTAMDHPRVWYKELIKKVYVRTCDKAFVYGTKSKEYLARLGMAEKNIITRCQATDNDKITAVNHLMRDKREALIAELGLNSRNFIYVGRLSPEKNVQRLLQALLKLKKEEPAAADWGLVVVGDGPLKDELRWLTKEFGLMDVRFVGAKAWHEVVEFYAMSDVLVLPSTSEPWGLVVNEAMVCGLPVLVSDRCGAAYDLVDEGKNGFVIDPYNVDDLTERMKYFVIHPERITEMGKRSIEIIAEYTPENAAMQMYAGIERVLADKAV